MEEKCLVKTLQKKWYFCCKLKDGWIERTGLQEVCCLGGSRGGPVWAQRHKAGKIIATRPIPAPRAPESTAFHRGPRTLVCISLSWRGLVKTQIPGAHSHNFWWDKAWGCAFNKFSGDADAVHLAPKLWKTLSGLLITGWFTTQYVSSENEAANCLSQRCPLFCFCPPWSMRSSHSPLHTAQSNLFSLVPPYSHNPYGLNQNVWSFPALFLVVIVVSSWYQMLWPLANLNFEILEGKDE